MTAREESNCRLRETRVDQQFSLTNQRLQQRSIQKVELRTELWMQAEACRVAYEKIKFILQHRGKVARSFFFILHRADHVAFRVFEEDERADRWNMKLGHDDLAAIGFYCRDRIVD